MFLPSDLVQRIFAGANPIKVIREHRGISVRTLARRTGIPLGVDPLARRRC